MKYLVEGTITSNFSAVIDSDAPERAVAMAEVCAQAGPASGATTYKGVREVVIKNVYEINREQDSTE